MTKLDILRQDRVLLFKQVEEAIRYNQAEILVILNQRIRSLEDEMVYCEEREQRRRLYAA